MVAPRGIYVGVAMHTIKATLAYLVVSLFSFGANAASLDSIQGSVQVNSGSGFHQVAGAAQVAPGTSVMAAPGGSAEILYSDGCRTPVRPGSVQVVAPVSPCALGQAAPGQGFQNRNQDNTIYDALLAAAIIGGSITAGVLSEQSNQLPASP
jgi:hypothetical protein